MKKLFLIVILCCSFIFTACGHEEYTGDILPLEQIPLYTQDQLTEMLRGKTKEEMNLAWGEKQGYSYTHPEEMWYVTHDDMRNISVYYDENNLVDFVVCDYDPSPSGTVGKEIPELIARWNGAEAEAVIMGYSWQYTENGETISVITDSAHPLDYIDNMNRMYADVHPYGQWDHYGITLYFDIEPDVIDGCWWPLERKGNTGTPAEKVLDVYEQRSIVYPPGNKVCQVTATWNNAGTVNYCFLLINDITEYNRIK